jgi:hypothetical protein
MERRTGIKTLSPMLVLDTSPATGVTLFAGALFHQPVAYTGTPAPPFSQAHRVKPTAPARAAVKMKVLYKISIDISRISL